jgi:transcriptional regulator with XRE-family HTH domain
MQSLLKDIRAGLSMSQAELAERLNVSFATVNRWENGHAVPNKLAQTALYDLCKEKNVPVYDMTLKRIAMVAELVKLDPNRVLLYHGSKSGIEGAIEPKSRKQCDFGCGFYMGTEPTQALTLICDYEKSKFYIVSVCTDELAHLEVAADINWAMLVAYHRGKMEQIQGTTVYNKYRDMSSGKDLIIGSIADDRMFYVIDNFFVGNVTDKALVGSLSALQLGKQYVAVTQKGCDAVRVEAEIPLSYLERMFMRDVSEQNRARGVSLANEICKNYRREGLFFDEILEEAKNGGSV